MKMILGLGNIGNEYVKTRHNVGFLCLEEFAFRHKRVFKTQSNYEYIEVKGCILLKPRTFMNLSGEAYNKVVKKFGHFEEMLVVLDDIDLPMGEIRIRTHGGAGGHNGLKSVIDHIGHTDFLRIRIGIGRPEKGTPREHVLDVFSHLEWEAIQTAFSTVADWLDLYINTNSRLLLDEYSKWKKRPIPSADDGINRPKEETND
jgi:peptidyl-tRNA hydrolase, PTH1 family